MKNRETRKRIIIFTLLCALVLGGFLASYAYFIAGSNNNNKEALKVNSGNMALTFSDGSSNFQGSLNIGESATKTFTIENTGSIDAVARLKWDNLINTYLSGSLTYSLSYRETEDGEYTEIISNKNVPRSQQPASRVLANDLSIPVGKTYYYKLTINLNYLENIDQTADLNAIFSTNFILEDISSELVKNVMIARASYDSTDYFWEHSENIKKVVFENSLYPKENASYTYDISEKKDGSVMSYLVPDTEDTSKYTLYIQANDYISANPDSSYWFYKFTNLESIEGLEYLDTSNVINMTCIFYSCTNLTSLDVSNFDTGNVTNMQSMFNNCVKLSSLDLSNFDTSKVTSMSAMFAYCSNLTSLDISNFDTSNVTNMISMFAECRNLTSLNLSNFDTSKVTSMSAMFAYCFNLTSLDVNNFDTSKVTDMNYMFHNCINLSFLDISSFDTSNVTTMLSMFLGCSSLTSLDLSNFDTSRVTNMSSMFNSCTNLISLDLSKFNTSNVTDMSSMFYNCSSLISLNVNNFNTSKVTSMQGMFHGCVNLTSLDLSKFNTSNVNTMEYMFENCTNLTSLNLSNFDTNKTYNTARMFKNCNKLTTTITIKRHFNSHFEMFEEAATQNGARIVVNYTSESSETVDKMIAGKSSNSNVVKGSWVNS